MKIEIEITDYLAPEEIKDIVSDFIRSTLASDRERILGNICYLLGEGYIDSILTGADKEFVVAKVNKLLSQESSISYQLFAERHSWDRRDKWNVSEIMQNTIEKNLDIIKNKTVSALNNIDEEKLREHIEENMSEIICLLLGKLKGN